jgi:hypothetical protein
LAVVFSWSLDVFHDGLSCNRGSLQFSTENRRNMKSSLFSFLWVIFAFLDPDPHCKEPIPIVETNIARKGIGIMWTYLGNIYNAQRHMNVEGIEAAQFPE